MDRIWEIWGWHGGERHLGRWSAGARCTAKRGITLGTTLSRPSSGVNGQEGEVVRRQGRGPGFIWWNSTSWGRPANLVRPPSSERAADDDEEESPVGTATIWACTIFPCGRLRFKYSVVKGFKLPGLWKTGQSFAESGCWPWREKVPRSADAERGQGWLAPDPFGAGTMQLTAQGQVCVPRPESLCLPRNVVEEEVWVVKMEPWKPQLPPEGLRLYDRLLATRNPWQHDAPPVSPATETGQKLIFDWNSSCGEQRRKNGNCSGQQHCFSSCWARPGHSAGDL